MTSQKKKKKKKKKKGLKLTRQKKLWSFSELFFRRPDPKSEKKSRKSTNKKKSGLKKHSFLTAHDKTEKRRQKYTHFTVSSKLLFLPNEPRVTWTIYKYHFWVPFTNLFYLINESQR